jgi:hypothetical protein
VELKEGVEFKRMQGVLKNLRKLSKNNLTGLTKRKRKTAVRILRHWRMGNNQR